MSILGEAAAAITGPALRAVLIPGLVLGTVTLAHQTIKARAEAKKAHEASLVNRGRQECITEVQLASARAALDAERRKVAAARDEAEAAGRLTAEVTQHVDTLRNELDAARTALAGGDPRCLSDSVWNSLRSAGGGGRGGQAGGGGGSGTSGARKAP